MKEKNIAKVYAESFVQLGKENNVEIAEEVTRLTETINASNELENLMFLDVFTIEEKTLVFEDIAKKLKLSSLLVTAVKYLIEQKRIGLFPLIFKEIIVKDDMEKGFLRGEIVGSEGDISEDHKNKLLAALKDYIGDKKPILTYKKSDDVTAGYKVTIEDLQLDASVDNQLKHFKESIIGE
ncbi:MAG: F0F1 ATP synthase subunit delta [Bacteriovoracaceae bacterium]|nr:F0F1 ATP synthase subunit delta [Bacteriovoracaceae bacterium]